MKWKNEKLLNILVGKKLNFLNSEKTVEGFYTIDNQFKIRTAEFPFFQTFESENEFQKFLLVDNIDRFSDEEHQYLADGEKYNEKEIAEDSPEYDELEELADEIPEMELEPKEPLPDNILVPIRQSLGLDEGDESRDDEIHQLPLHQALKHFLEWEGIIGYTGQIMDIVDYFRPEYGSVNIIIPEETAEKDYEEIQKERKEEEEMFTPGDKYNTINFIDKKWIDVAKKKLDETEILYSTDTKSDYEIKFHTAVEFNQAYDLLRSNGFDSSIIKLKNVQ